MVWWLKIDVLESEDEEDFYVLCIRGLFEIFEIYGRK
jgi:hypothetical protein